MQGKVMQGKTWGWGSEVKSLQAQRRLPHHHELLREKILSQNFGRKISVAFSLLFDKIYPTMD
jgi:hypothetical protein